MIDLHTHTIHSDGADTTAELLSHADALGIEVLSITDHNSVAAYGDQAVADYKKPLIPGVEITCMYEGEVVEVLGYGYRLEAMEKELKKHVLTFEEKQRQEFELICETLTWAGVRFDPTAVTFDPTKESCRKALLKEIKKTPFNYSLFGSEESWNSSRAFARQEIYNPKSRLYVDESPLYPDVHTAVEMIHRSGGIAFFAHLYVYSHAQEFRERLYEIVKEMGLDGIECAHSSFTVAQIADLNRFCLEHGLLRSGGSDYHGSRKPDVKLGTGCGHLHIPSEYMETWPLQR